MRWLRWLAAVVLLIVLMGGIGSVMAYVFGDATIVALGVGASLVVLAWHGLRAIEPRPESARPQDGWQVALVGVVSYAALVCLAFWTPWVIVFAWITFPIWVWTIRRSR